MHRTFFRLLTSLMLGCVFLFTGGSTPVGDVPALSTGSATHTSAAADPASSFAKMPLLFVQNQGQLDDRVAYYLQGRDTTIYFSADGLTYSLTEASFTGAENELRAAADPAGGWTLKLDFLGADPGVLPRGADQAKAVISYFKGPPDQWHTGLPTFRRLVYANLWPGIDLAYTGAPNRLKYEFVVQPGADPAQIRLAYRGASGLKLTPTGQLEISTPLGSLFDEAPLAYQVSQGKQAPVRAVYALFGPAAGGTGLAYGFQVADYDPTLPLIIDPAIILYCGYIGGSADDAGNAIAVDAYRAIYVTGYTYSTQATFPEQGGPDLIHNGLRDAFVAKVDMYGDMIYAGFIGGSQDDIGTGIAVDSNGDAYVVGQTRSDQATFPTLIGPDLSHNGNYDGFIVKVFPNGDGLLYAGYIGGAGDDYATAVAVDSSGAAYVAGRTGSTEATFPVLNGPDSIYNNSGDAFVSKVRSDGVGLAYSGYIGGGGQDEGWGIAVDSAGAAYVTGLTSSLESSFPVAVGPDLTHNGGMYDAFITRVRADGFGLEYAGYIGGPGMDFGSGVAVDKTGAAFVVGYSNSPILNHSGGYDAFVVKVRANGTGPERAGFFGGINDDFGTGIALNGDGYPLFTGYTSSDQSTFPVMNGPDKTFNGGEDAFIAMVSPQLNAIVYSGYIGGSSYDRAYGIAVDWRGSAYVTGMTNSTYYTFPVFMGPDTTQNGLYDAFVVKINMIYRNYMPNITKQ